MSIQAVEPPPPTTDHSSRGWHVTTRSSCNGDGSLLLDLYAETCLEELSHLGWNLVDHRPLVLMHAQLREAQFGRRYPDLNRLTICVDGRPVGRLLLERGPSDLHLVDLCLIPSLRGQGIGTRLLRELLGEAAGEHLNVSVTVPAGNRTDQLWERLGFTEVRRLDTLRMLCWRPSADVGG